VIGNGVRSFVPDHPYRAGTGDGSGGKKSAAARRRTLREGETNRSPHAQHV